MDAAVKKQLQIQACKVRMGVIEGVFNAKSGHPGGSLSIADILTYLYFNHMNVDPRNPKWEDRDRFVLSKGHTAPALYAVLAHKGFFSVDEIKTLRKPGSMLQGHPSMKLTPGVDMCTGSLGQGISTAVGMALGAKLGGKSYRVFTALGDGEIQEGQIWEALMFAAAKKVDNLIVTVDNNGKQIDGPTEDVLDFGDLRAKFEAFGWTVLDMNGNDMNDCVETINKAKSLAFNGKPIAIIMKTEMGQGVDYMMGTHKWHGAAPNDEQAAAALAQLPVTLGDY